MSVELITKETIFLTNKTEKLTNNAIKATNGFTKNQINTYTSTIKDELLIENKQTDIKIKSCEKKFIQTNNNEDYKISVTSIYESSLENISNLKTRNITSITETFENYNNNINHELNFKTDNLVSTSKFNLINSGIDLLDFPDEISLLESTVDNILQNGINSINSIVGNAINECVSKVHSLVDPVTNNINSILNDIPNLPTPSSLLDLKSTGSDIFQKVKYDFFEKDIGLSSCSRYIQAQIPSKTGSIKKQPNVLLKTPDEKIIIPQLKKDINKVLSFGGALDLARLNPSNLLNTAVNVAQSQINSTVSGLTTQVSTLINGNISSSINNLANQTLTDVISPVNSILGEVSQVSSIASNLTSQASSLLNLPTDNLTIPDSLVPNIPSISSLQSKTEEAINALADPSSMLSSLMSNISLTIPSIEGVVSTLIPKQEEKTIKEEKPSGEKAEYGKIQIKENKGGFVEISDETPGNVRKINLHPTGTYDSKLDNGDAHTKTTGKKVDIVDKNWEVTVFEDRITIVSGDEKIEIRKNLIENIEGSHHSNVDGERKTKIKKDVIDDFVENYSQKVGKESNRDITGNDNHKISGNQSTKISGNQKDKISGNLSITVSGSININASGQVNVSSSSQITISAPKIKLTG